MHEAGDSTPSVFALVDRILPVALIASTCAVLFWVCFCRPEGGDRPDTGNLLLLKVVRRSSQALSFLTRPCTLL